MRLVLIPAYGHSMSSDVPTPTPVRPAAGVLELLARRRVTLSYVGALAYLLLARPRLPGLAAGAVVMLLGEGVRLWASGHIRKNQAVATTGPYARVRHPLYFGSAIIGVGLALAAGSWALGLALLAALGLLFGAAVRREERRLGERFTVEYAAYRQAVPAFVPRLTPYDRGGRFDWDGVKRHREWRAVLGLVAGLGVLGAKALLG